MKCNTKTMVTMGWLSRWSWPSHIRRYPSSEGP